MLQPRAQLGRDCGRASVYGPGLVAEFIDQAVGFPGRHPDHQRLDRLVGFDPVGARILGPYAAVDFRGTGCYSVHEDIIDQRYLIPIPVATMSLL